MANSQENRKVFVALSGGVDSSVAAALLLKRGYEVVGCHIKCYNLDGCGERDAEDARRVAEQLNIPFYVFDLEEGYKKKVVEYMVDGYRRGITPNPDVMCNKEIKFGIFLKKALSLGADYIATGHYVKLNMRPIRPMGPISSIRLKIAHDLNKDQSYFLWTLTQNQLKHCLFPIGDYTKKQIRALANKFGLITAEKKDSQGICFLGKVTLADFLKQYLPEKRGAVLSVSGEKIGEHRGAHFYTIGQRRIRIMNYESGIKGRRNAKPCYVADKNIQKNTIVVAEKGTPALYKKEIKLTAVNFISPKLKIVSLWEMPRRGKNCKLKIPVLARVRYRQPLQEAALISSLIPNSKFLILKFDRPVKFVAPGQSAVFYNNKGEMLGGGIIAAD